VGIAEGGTISLIPPANQDKESGDRYEKSSDAWETRKGRQEDCVIKIKTTLSRADSPRQR